MRAICKGANGVVCLINGVPVDITSKKYLKMLENDISEIPEYTFGKINLLYFEITEKCNFRCIHCYNAPYRKKKTMDLTTFKSIVKKLKKLYDVRIIQITGGEPTVVENLPQYIKYALANFPSVQVFTNGYLLDREELATFDDVLFRVSFYSLDQKIYEKITNVKGSFHRVLHNILNGKESGMKISVEIPIIPGINDKTANLTIKYFKAKGFHVKYSTIIPYGNATSRNVELKKSVPHFRAQDLTKRWAISIKYNNCWATHLAINPKGDVMPCIFAREYILGNAVSDSIEKIFENHKKLCEEYKPDNYKICKDCKYRYLCRRCVPRSKAYGLEKICEAWCDFEKVFDNCRS